MNKKILSLILLTFLLIPAYFPIVAAHNPGVPYNPQWPFPSTYDATHAIVDTIGEPETLDPAWCYDTGSAEVIFNVYEPVIFYDTVWTDGPYSAGKSTVFKPMLATSVSIMSGPAPYVKTFYFKIRGVGTEHTFQAVDGGLADFTLFKDGNIYDGSYATRDLEYGMVGKTVGPIEPENNIPPATDGAVSQFQPHSVEYTGTPVPTPPGLWAAVKDTTWKDITTGPGHVQPFEEGCVIRSVSDTGNVPGKSTPNDGVLNAGDKFDVVHKAWNPPKGPWWNVREYWTVKDVISTNPYTITTEDDPVYFHNGATLTPEDVEYSWERWLVQDRSGGPQWMLYYPMLNTYGAADPADDPDFGVKIDSAIGSNATHAWISLETDFPETTFLQIMSQSWASVMNKAWCVAKGDLNLGVIESIYRDIGTTPGSVDGHDVLKNGPAKPNGTPLIGFRADEKHTDGGSAVGFYDAGESIYRDVGTTPGSVDAADVRLKGLPRPNGTPLIGFRADEKHTDEDGDGFYDPSPWLNWQAIWNTWHDPGESFVENDMMGTGPFKFSYWNHGTSYSVVKYDGYWDGWPAYVFPTGTEREAGYLSRVTWNLLVDWTTRKDRFLAGDSDFTAVPRQYNPQIRGVSVGGEPIRCFYPIEPQLAVDAEFFNFDINTQSPYMGVSGGLPPGTFAENGIPPDIFSDIHVRRAFAAAFDYNLFLSAAYLNEATQPADPIIPGLSYDNPAQKKPVFDLALAASELQAAWNGELWAHGMTFTLLFNEGNVARETASTMLANNIMGLNENFHLSVQQVAWGSTYLPQMVARMLPLFSIGWLVDYPDPDNFAFPFMHTYGTFSDWQSYSNARVDELIEYGALMPMDTAAYNLELDKSDPRPYFNNAGNLPPDTRWPRRSTYYEIQAIYVDDCPGFCLDQAVGRGFQQAWVRGWYYNPVYPGGYFRDRWKAKCHFGDVNNDNTVFVLDAAAVSASWSKPAPDSTLGPLGYRIQADMTGGSGGTANGGTGLIVGIHDGKVSVVDSALVSAYWDGPPKGPKHP